MPKKYNKGKNKPNRMRGGGHSELSLLSSNPLVQRKRLDISLAATAVTSTLSATWITGAITGGSTMSTRVGNRIHIQAILIDTWVTSGDASNCVRGILTKSLNGQQGTPTLASWYLPLDGDAYFPLDEKRINTSNSTSTAITKPLKMWYSFKGRGLPVRYDSNAASSEISPRLMFSYISDSVAAPDPSIQGYIRVYFTDA